MSRYSAQFFFILYILPGSVRCIERKWEATRLWCSVVIPYHWSECTEGTVVLYCYHVKHLLSLHMNWLWDSYTQIVWHNKYCTSLHYSSIESRQYCSRIILPLVNECTVLIGWQTAHKSRSYRYGPQLVDVINIIISLRLDHPVLQQQNPLYSGR